VKWDVSIVALAVLAVAFVSRRLSGTAATPTMAFVAIGVLVGPLVVDELRLDPNREAMRVLTEAALTVVLFGDASRVRLRALRHEFTVPLRLLAIGLPLTIALGAAAALVVFPHLTTTEALVLAVVLAPTDAALGQAVVSAQRLPSRIRQGLSVESGLNDGICVPLLLIALGAAGAESHTGFGFSIVAKEIGYGVLGGVASGLLTGTAVAWARRRDLIADSWLPLIPVAAAALAYGLATALHGSGFVAAFVAGALFGALAGPEAEEASRFGEELGELLTGITFLAFGAVLLGPELEHLHWDVVAYSVLSLTLVRLLPVAVAMLGTRTPAPTAAFLGWFGPRGLASIVFAIIVVQEAHLPEASTLLAVTYTTIGLSVFAHGASAAPLTNLYTRWHESTADVTRLRS
jgi:NhaP-type Na+/H+ or K+/H+ antiporter